MSFSNDLIYPVNKLPTFTKKELLNKNNSNIINLILPGYKKGSSIFKLNEKIIPKLFLSKNRYSLKNLNLKHRVALLKDKGSHFYNKDKIIIKSNSENKINIIRKKNNSFCIPNNIKIIHNDSLKNINSKNETFSKLKLDIKNNNTSRNISYNGNSVDLTYLNKNINNNNITFSKQNKKIKKTKSYLVKNKNILIPKFKNKINLTLCEDQQKKINYLTKYKISENKIQEKNNTYRHIPINISDKENINSTNLNESNTNESFLLFSKPKKNNKRRINLPFSPTSINNKFYKQIKYKKCYIRNSKNESNIPFNKNNKLTRQNSYYNLNIFNLKKSQNKILTNREEGNSFAEIDIFKKNNSMSSFDMPTKTNSYSYYNNNELCIISKENNIEYITKNNVENFGVEMNHFRIVKIIQNNKNMLIKNEKNI